MKALPVLLLLGGATALGVVLGIQYLRRIRSQPVLIGMHLLLGAGGMEVLAMLLRGAPDGTLWSGTGMVKIAAGLVALAMVTGLVAPMIGRGSRRTMNVALATHVSIAVAGIALLLAWLLRGGAHTLVGSLP